MHEDDVDVDSLIEDMFGYKSDKPPKAPEPPQKPRKKKAKATTTDSPEDQERAARAVLEAVTAHTGKVRSVKSWRSVAAKALGLKRLIEARWQGVLDRGIELGLFTLDDTTYSYPVIAPAPEPEPEEPEGGSAPEVQIRSEPKDVGPPDKPPKAEFPPGWKPPTVMDCGHMTWWMETVKDEDGVETTRCAGCAKRVQPHWTRLKGKYVRPIPTALRRTAEKAKDNGFPGYCVDEDGYYIGGATNDCQRENPKNKSKWCKHHRDLAAERLASRKKS